MNAGKTLKLAFMKLHLFKSLADGSGIFVSYFLLGLLGSPAMGQPCPAPKSSFWRTDNHVYAIAESGGVVYLGGAFNYVGPANGKAGVVALASGQAQADFPFVNGSVYAVLSDGKGGWILGGDFLSVGGYRMTNLVHILSDNQVDLEWNPAPDDSVLALARTSDTVFVGGNFQRIDGLSRPYVAALTLGSGEATTWAPQVNGTVNALVVAGNLLYVGGQFTSVNKTSRPAIAAMDLTLSTNYVTSWNPSASGGSRIVYAMAVDGNTVYAGGDFTTIGGKPRNRLAALDASSGQSATWNPNPDDTVRAIAVSGTSVFVGGDFANVGARSRYRLAALDKSGLGAANSTWDAGVDSNESGSTRITTLTLVDSTLYFAGQFVRVGGELRRGVAALDAPTGQLKAWQPLVSSLSPSVKPTVWALALDSSNACLGGDFSSWGGYARGKLAALDAVSGAATSWNPNAGNNVYALAVVTNTVYVGGIFTNMGATARNRLAAVDTATGTATTWNPGVSGSGNYYVYTLNVSSNTLYAGGSFNQIGGKSFANAVAFDLLTGETRTWAPNPDGLVYAISTESNLVYLGGQFYTVGGSNRAFIAAVNTDSGKATAWNPNADGYVYSLVVGKDYVYAGGDFSRVGGQSRNRIAAVEKTTGLAALWSPEAGGSGTLRIYAMTPCGNFLYAGGLFTSIGGEFRNRLVSLDLLMGVSVEWNPGTDAAVRSMVIANGQMFLGGEFTKVSGQSQPYFAVFSLGSRFDPATVKRNASGHLQCQVTDGGSPGNNVSIQTSTNLVDWTTVSTYSVTGFPVNFTDNQSAVSAFRFYRAVVLP
jgi:trimeric autotransporter adhesin